MDFHIPEISAKGGLTTQDRVYQRLRQAIMLGMVPPGTAITMRGLAEAMGVSPTPIREALRRLSSEWAVEVQSNRRMLVPAMDRQRFGELIALRTALETHAAGRALPHVTDRMIDALAALDSQMDLALAGGDTEALNRLNYEFHRQLYAANSSPAAMPLIESLWLQLGPFHRQAVTAMAGFYREDRHKQILNALRRRDAAGLTAAIRDDIEDGVARPGWHLLECDG